MKIVKKKCKDGVLRQKNEVKRGCISIFNMANIGSFPIFS